ncbi:MAG: DUF1028 domain-containing protein [Parvibaculaceae bacterium]
MTFTIVGRCNRTGHRGIAIATSSPAVGNRCTFVSHAGAVAFQAVAEPRLGVLSLRLLEQGYSPRKVISDVTSSDDWPGKRQIGIVDREGRTAAFTGDDNMAWAGHITGDNFVAMGNLLASPQVVEAIAEGFHERESDSLEMRLMHAIEAGRDAGGQDEGQTSAAIISHGEQSVARCDLRVDLSDEPVAELRRIFDWYEPLLPYYEERNRNPNVPRVKDYFKNLGLERTYGKPVPVTRGGSKKFPYKP